MARRSAAGRLLVGAIAAICLWQLLGAAFIAPRAPLRAAEQGAAGAALAGAIVVAPQAASAAELTYDGFGPPELVAITIPLVWCIVAYLEWESKQESTDDVTGAGTLGNQIDGPGKGSYFRRSPESG
mmetsp:Transcript_75845/g.171584  ORF Transcript_75845/g.171584 Transcript_75845/m.171584 type:complete len:127 (+) Transcript_75845:71-451(+)